MRTFSELPTHTKKSYVSMVVCCVARMMTMMMIDSHIFSDLFWPCSSRSYVGGSCCCCKNRFSVCSAYWSRSSGFDIPSFDSIIYIHVHNTRLLSCNVCSLCTHSTFDILIKIRFSQWSAAEEKNKSISENQNCLHFYTANIFSFIEFEVST